jgi:hypothetical protein
MNMTLDKTTYAKDSASYDMQLVAGGAAALDAGKLLPWTGTLRTSSERRAIVRAAQPTWSREYQELVIREGDVPR